MPDKIKYNNIIYNWDISGYLHYEDEHYSERAFLEGYRTDMCLNYEVEILEDNTEEIEELDVDKGLQEIDRALIIQNRNKINELVRRIKYIERKINE